MHYTKLKVPVFIGVVIILIAVFPAEWFGWANVNFFDKFEHLLGGIVVAWFFSVFLNKELKLTSKFKAGIIIIATVCLVGVLWEFSEYLSSTYGPLYAPIVTKHFYIGDLADTLGDILSDLLGGLVFALLYTLKLRSK